MNLLLIAIGGALGSVARYLLSIFVLRVTGTLFPLGTFVVNVVGCLVFGAGLLLVQAFFTEPHLVTQPVGAEAAKQPEMAEAK